MLKLESRAYSVLNYKADIDSIAKPAVATVKLINFLHKLAY